MKNKLNYIKKSCRVTTRRLFFLKFIKELLHGSTDQAQNYHLKVC
jgi:hypothetical protein